MGTNVALERNKSKIILTADIPFSKRYVMDGNRKILFTMFYNFWLIASLMSSDFSFLLFVLQFHCIL